MCSRDIEEEYPEITGEVNKKYLLMNVTKQLLSLDALRYTY